MKFTLVLFCLVSTVVGLPFNFGGFGGQASGNAQGLVTEGQSYNPDGTTSQIINTGSNALSTSANGAPSFSNAQASNFQGLGGTSFSNTGASSVQPGGFHGGLPGFGFGGQQFGFGGFDSQASGQAQGTVTEGQSYGPQGGTSHIISTGSNAGGSSTNGAPSISNAHASNVQGPGGTSHSNTGASSIQPGFNGGGFGGGFGGFGGFGGYGGGYHGVRH